MSGFKHDKRNRVMFIEKKNFFIGIRTAGTDNNPTHDNMVTTIDYKHQKVLCERINSRK